MEILKGYVSQHPLISIALAVGLLYLIQVAYALRQGLSWLLQAFLACGVLAVIAFLFARNKGMESQSAELIGIAVGGIASKFYPRRSRHIPSHVKRKLVQDYEKNGQKYNSKEHHLDHRVPFSKGGSHSTDNLRIISKKKNLKKGAKMPTPFDWFS